MASARPRGSVSRLDRPSNSVGVFVDVLACSRAHEGEAQGRAGQGRLRNRSMHAVGHVPKRCGSGFPVEPPDCDAERGAVQQRAAARHHETQNVRPNRNPPSLAPFRALRSTPAKSTQQKSHRLAQAPDLGGVKSLRLVNCQGFTGKVTVAAAA